MEHNLTAEQQQRLNELREKVLFEARMYHISKSRLIVVHVYALQRRL